MPTKAIRGQKLFDEIIRMSDQFEGKYKRAFLRSMLTVTNDKELKSLIKDISDGNIGVGSSIGSRLDKVRVDIAEMNEISRQTMVKAANVTKKVMNLSGSFDVVNDAVIEAARQMSIQLSTNLRATTREALRQVIEDFAAGDISRQEAIRQIQMNVGLLPQHAQAVKTYRQTLLSSGTPRAKANQLAEQYAKRLLKYRADMIARTEVGRAVGIGKTNFWRQMQQQDMLPPDAQRVWITEPVGACPFCISMNGVPASIDGGWDTSKGYLEYPKASHPNCRCDDGIIMATPKKSQKVSKADELEWEHFIYKHLSGKHDQKTHGRSRTKISAKISAGTQEGTVKVNYGEMSFTTWDGGLDGSDYDYFSEAFREWEVWEGNYRMRHASAAFMGLSSPIAEGKTKGNKIANEIVATGKLPKSTSGNAVESERINEGVGTAEQSVLNANVMLGSIAIAEPTEFPLHRGMSVEPNASVLKMREGETFAMPLTAFSYSSRVAMDFTGGKEIGFGTDAITVPAEGRIPILITLRRGAKAVDSEFGVEVENPRTGTTTELPIESITQGKFRISGISNSTFPDGRKGKIVAIEQIEVYDPASQRFVKKSDDSIPDWVWELGGSFTQANKIKRK